MQSGREEAYPVAVLNPKLQPYTSMFNAIALNAVKFINV
jgi:hypothetical protein